jgi:hypothetical protein
MALVLELVFVGCFKLSEITHVLRILVEHLGTQIYLGEQVRSQAPSRPSPVLQMSFEMTTCHSIKQAENCRFLSRTVLNCRQHGTCQLLAQSHGIRRDRNVIERTRCET